MSSNANGVVVGGVATRVHGVTPRLQVEEVVYFLVVYILSSVPGTPAVRQCPRIAQLADPEALDYPFTQWLLGLVV